MPILQDDRFTRGAIGHARHSVSGLHFVLMFVSVALLVLARLNHPWMHQLEAGAGDLARAPMTLAAEHLEFFVRLRDRLRRAATDEPILARLRAENARLRAENRALKQHDAERIALTRIARLAADDTDERRTARIIARGNGPFRHVLTIDVGRAHGARRGHPVVREGQLIGHLAWVGERVSRVLLLADERSRIPVIIGETSVPAIAAGGHGSGPRLLFLPRDAEIQTGDRVTTSGAGNVLPLGLHLGVVSKDGPFWHLTPSRTAAVGPLVQVILHEPHKLLAAPIKRGPLATNRRVVIAPQPRVRPDKSSGAVRE